jgi:c-di-GMP-binding flagellar brake protein YcgR
MQHPIVFGRVSESSSGVFESLWKRFQDFVWKTLLNFSNGLLKTILKTPLNKTSEEKNVFIQRSVRNPSDKTLLEENPSPVQLITK